MTALLIPANTSGPEGPLASNPVSWDGVPNPSHASPAVATQRVSDWIVEAGRRQASSSKRQFASLRQQRLQLLRSGNIKAWARRMRPTVGPNAQYSPPWVTDPDGSRRRPSSSGDVLLGAQQDWGRLLQEPTTHWHHQAVGLFGTDLLPRRGSVNFHALANSAVGSPLYAVGRAILTPGPWCFAPFSAETVQFHSASTLSVGAWLLRISDGDWWAQRPSPCPGHRHLVLSCGHIPGQHLTLDHFRWPADQAVLCLRLWEEPDHTFVAPTVAAERLALLSKFRNSRPGPSGWKLCYLEAFPPWVQDIFWLALDVQRQVGFVAQSLHLAEQVHLPKPAGGWRPLSMLEESFKAIEAPVANRLSASRSPWQVAYPFSALNLAYVRGVSAAAEVLYTDTLVCEDVLRATVSLSCASPRTLRNFSILSSFPSSMPCNRPAASRIRFAAYTNLFSLLPACSVSSPELSKAAQEPILRLRASDGAAYCSSGGRRIVASGYVDDVEHYGAGLRDLPTVLDSLSLGSSATGVGYAWSKFSAFASDWDATLPDLQDPRISAVGAAAPLCEMAATRASLQQDWIRFAETTGDTLSAFCVFCKQWCSKDKGGVKNHIRRVHPEHWKQRSTVNQRLKAHHRLWYKGPCRACHFRPASSALHPPIRSAYFQSCLMHQLLFPEVPLDHGHERFFAHHLSAASQQETATERRNPPEEDEPKSKYPTLQQRGRRETNAAGARKRGASTGAARRRHRSSPSIRHFLYAIYMNTRGMTITKTLYNIAQDWKRLKEEGKLNQSLRVTLIIGMLTAMMEKMKTALHQEVRPALESTRGPPTRRGLAHRPEDLRARDSGGPLDEVPRDASLSS
eukprot:s10379_g2.t1